ALAATAGKPAVGERVPQLVWVEALPEPRLPSTLSDHLRDAAVGQPTLPPHPEPGKPDVARALPHPDVPLERADRLCPDADDALAPPFAEHPQDAPVEVDVIRGLV